MSRGAEGADERIEKPPHTEHCSARTAMLQYTISVKYFSPDFHLDVEKESLLLGRFAVQY